MGGVNIQAQNVHGVWVQNRSLATDVAHVDARSLFEN